MNTSATFPVPESNAISRLLEGETVLVLPHRGTVNVLNELGQFVWKQVNGSQSVEQIVAAVCKEYAVMPEQARQDVVAFLQTLEQKGALRLESRPG